MKHFVAVITTVQLPTRSVRCLHKTLERIGGHLIVVGDKKGPKTYDLPNTTFLSLKAQLEMDFHLARLLPEGHYSRKNMGYLNALSQRVRCIYETDDDNAPITTLALKRKHIRNSRVVSEGNGRWVNAYSYFTEAKIWPRGYPLDEILCEKPLCNDSNEPQLAPIQQGLVNKAPDVDAIWRLVFGQEVYFDPDSDILYMKHGNWCPFNSQNTWWWPEAYPLMYIPSFCSFRMCDIWRSFVALKCVWAMGAGIAFTPADCFQERNPHKLIRDFEDEVAGYVDNKRFVQVLETICLSADSNQVGENLRTCYDALVKNGFFPVAELELIDAWLDDIKCAN